jgi:hypothetical protein
MAGIARKNAGAVAVGKEKPRSGIHLAGLYHLQREHLNHMAHERMMHWCLDKGMENLQRRCEDLGYLVAFL